MVTDASALHGKTRSSLFLPRKAIANPVYLTGNGCRTYPSSDVSKDLQPFDSKWEFGEYKGEENFFSASWGFLKGTYENTKPLYVKDHPTICVFCAVIEFDEKTIEVLEKVDKAFDNVQIYEGDGRREQIYPNFPEAYKLVWKLYNGMIDKGKTRQYNYFVNDLYMKEYRQIRI